MINGLSGLTGLSSILASVPGSGSGVSPPVASFTGTPTAGDAPLLVSFTDSSSNTPTGWNWDFGDGGTSVSQNPSRSYSSAGIYSVTLTASNAGGSGTLTRTNYINVTAASGVEI
jgi:PKD repeat protein